MKSALLFGFGGSILCFILGIHYLDLSPEQIIRCLVGANVAGFVALSTVLKLQRMTWIRKTLVTGPASAWVTFYALYFAIQFLFAPDVHTSLKPFLALFVPLMMSTGFAVLLFGPFHDRIIHKLQKNQPPKQT